MTLPGAERVELPVLQELAATGGTENVKFLYARLVDYFPQLDERERTQAREHAARTAWTTLVQRAGRLLVEKKQLERQHGVWKLTAHGRKRLDSEAIDFTNADSSNSEAAGKSAHVVNSPTHQELQQMLIEIGRALGYYAEAEFERIDVVWRANRASPRISHAFEVQRKGNIDAALAKLKQAYERQRSKPFLIVINENDTRRARRQMSAQRAGAFHEIETAATILSGAQIAKLHRALLSVEDVLAKVFE